MIKIKKGHDSSSYFWIMPVKVKDINKNTNNMDNVDECKDLEISIEEEDINSFLRPILLEIFNDYLYANKKKKNRYCSLYKSRSGFNIWMIFNL